MNIQERILIQLAEEASEISQALIKCLRFGVNHAHVTGGKSNVELVQEEFTQFTALADLLARNGGPLVTVVYDDVYKKKLAQFEKYDRIAAEINPQFLKE
jgi:diphthamide synthase subunit DPH2